MSYSEDYISNFGKQTGFINSIIEKAETASAETIEASTKEKVQFVLSEYQIDRYSKNNSNYDNNNLSLQDKIVLESDYVQKNISAFRYIRNRDYIRASESYKQCLDLSNKLGNSFKIKDSLCNYGVSLYYCGNFEEAVTNLEMAFNKLSNKDINYINNKSDFLNIKLSTKIISNLIMLYLCLNNFNIAKIMIDHLKNILNSFDFMPDLQLNLIKNINYIFFRIESLVNLDEHLGGLPRDAHHQVIIRIMKGFHSYLKNNNIDIWINCLNSEIENLKNLKDYNGIILALMNIQTGNYIKGRENMMLVSQKCCIFVPSCCFIITKSRNEEYHYRRPDVADSRRRGECPDIYGGHHQRRCVPAHEGKVVQGRLYGQPFGTAIPEAVALRWGRG